MGFFFEAISVYCIAAGHAHLVLRRGESFRTLTAGEGVLELMVEGGPMDTTEGARGNAEKRLKFVNALNGFPLLLDGLLSWEAFSDFTGGYGGAAMQEARDRFFPCPETDPEPFWEESFITS